MPWYFSLSAWIFGISIVALAIAGPEHGRIAVPFVGGAMLLFVLSYVLAMLLGKPKH